MLHVVQSLSFACHSSTCAPPPTGSGGSLPGSDVPISPISSSSSSGRNVFRQFDKLTEIQIAEAFTQTNNEWSAKAVVFRESIGHSFAVSGVISDKDGAPIGEFKRRIMVDSQTRKLIASHDYLSINYLTMQGKGIGTAINAKALKFYHEAGVNDIEVYASSTGAGAVGPYAWAKAGFRFRDNIDRTNVAEVFEKYGSENRQYLSQGTKNDLDAVLQAVRDGADVQPIHFASIGKRDAGRSHSWFGKDLMTGQFDETPDYEAVYHL
jgi:hypothetical protein